MSIAPDVGHHPAARSRAVTAILGPTNTGKTHLAIERMLGHESGVIGLPLRLLAREVYNRVVERAGAEAVALVTGEEKIKPENPKYWVCTVEAMPRDLDVAFVAIDEVQLAADLDRGHVFTDRILRRRGREETLLLGAATMRPILTRMMPNLNVITRPRLSHLAYSGQKKITRLPRRSAIVAFSADDVYAIAELVRRQRGGAAVVLGALSPRTRNAQVGLYQNGDVDFLVATDAIGMGLNLDVDHVAFAARRKFDGWQFRDLNPAEMGQVAGRAGRHMRDGTFGVTGRVDPLEDELVARLESHDFEPVRILQWRNTHLDFATMESLHASLAALPREDTLTRAPASDDVLALEAVARDLEIADIARGRDAVELLWDVCQVPDYRKIAPANHAELVATLYSQLMRYGHIDDDWFARQIGQCDRDDGDIDTLSNRIAHIRTWTFVANRPEWLGDPAHWQERARAVEDRLSDALHERLAQRFVDRRTSVLARSLRENPAMEAEIDASGDVTVEGHHVGRLEGLRFTPDPEADGQHLKAIAAAARRTLTGELNTRAERLAKDADEVIQLSLDGTFSWRGATIGRVEKGDSVLSPRVVLLADEHLAGAPRENAEARLAKWIDGRIAVHLGPLRALESDEAITGMARGVAFQLGEALGVLERPRVADEVKALSQDDRAQLRKHGVRFGAHHVYLPILLKPGPRVLAAQLWALHHGGLHQPGFDDIAALAQSGRMSVAVAPGTARSLYRAFGFRACGSRAVRIDILERIADLIRTALSWRPDGDAAPPPGAVDGRTFRVSEQMTSLAGCAGDDFAEILKALGYRSERRPAPATTEAKTEPAPQTADAGDAATTSEHPGTETETAAEAARVETAETPAVTSEGDPQSDTETVSEAVESETVTPDVVTPEVVEPTAAPAEAEPAEAEPAEAAAAPAEGPAEAQTETPVEATVDTPAETTAETPTETPDGTPTETATATEVPEAGTGEAESAEIVVWRPGRRPDAPRRRKPEQKGAKARQGDGKKPSRGEAKGRKSGRGDGRKGGRSRPDGPPQGKRPPKEPDPLSPFAALKDLRDTLNERGRSGA
ncbi:helicase-related protein [Microbaculum marinisediminis]|uniref:Helicase n=1 Tax=Microbaculum marinisediminis TaxID=2931392 RepID=A0AAW5QYU8_9HYPH|nr:helicase-related protein [Microbaculum sp. A6E488]MCT8971450.1 helicase [Microbaculum sp. A6E488]